MEQIFKAFMGIIILFLVAFTGIGIVVASMDASHAEEYASDVASIIEASNYSDTVINNCAEKAAEMDYILTVSKRDVDGDGRTDMAEVIIEYKYSIPILNITGSTHEAKAFAR